MHARNVLRLAREERQQLRFQDDALGAPFEERRCRTTAAREAKALTLDPVLNGKVFGVNALDVTAHAARYERAERILAPAHRASSMARFARRSATALCS